METTLGKSVTLTKPDDFGKLLSVVANTTASAAEREGGSDDRWQSHMFQRGQGLLARMGKP